MNNAQLEAERDILHRMTQNALKLIPAHHTPMDAFPRPDEATTAPTRPIKRRRRSEDNESGQSMRVDQKKNRHRLKSSHSPRTEAGYRRMET